MRLTVAEHVLDVGGERRIGVNIFPDLAGCDAEAHRQSENIHELLARMPDEMRAENVVGRLIDDHLRPRDGLGIGFGGEPAEHVVGVNVDGKAFLPGRSLCQADRRKRRHGCLLYTSDAADE